MTAVDHVKFVNCADLFGELNDNTFVPSWYVFLTGLTCVTCVGC